LTYQRRTLPPRPDRPDRANNIFKESEKYWTPVPGSNFYLAAANLADYNIRYVEPSDIEFVEQELGSGVVITPLPPERGEDDLSSIE
jgi:hypothetical protein